MGVTFHANNGKKLDMNFGAKQLLEKLTICWWDKLGIPSRISKADTSLIARTLENYIALQSITNRAHQAYLWRVYGLDQETEPDIEYWKKACKFFKESGGIKKRE